MTRIALLALFALLPAGAEAWLGLPDQAPTPTDEAGRLVEDWGTVAVGVVSDQAPEWEVGISCAWAPTVTRRCTVGSVVLESRAWRTPAWPNATDVLTLTAANRGAEPASVPVELALPEAVSLSGGTGTIGGRVVLRYDSETAVPGEMRDWGYTDGGSALPGWGHPSVPCDPAFANIRAGMGGVKLAYLLQVKPGTSWNVAVGLMESHWDAPGQRPVIVAVEGEDPITIDPIAVWGQHKPGVAMFVGRDLNADGKLRIEVRPVKGAPDENTILNALWLFPRDLEPDANDVVSGRLNDQAAAYVDVGGAGDQAFYTADAVRYDLSLAPGESRELTFCLACRDGGLPERDADWTAATLRKAADDIWRDWFAQGAAVSLGDPSATAALRDSLALLVMCRAQAGGYFVSLPQGAGIEGYAPHEAWSAVGALDAAGQHLEARRMMRLYWQAPPEPLAACAAKSGGYALCALGLHAQVTRDSEWCKAVLPAVTERVAQLGTPAGPDAWIARSAIEWASQLAGIAGEAEQSTEWLAAARGMAESARPSMTGSAVLAAATSVVSRLGALARADADGLTLLDGAEVAWFEGEGITVERLPTRCGPVSLTARAVGERVTVTVDPPADASKVVVVAPRQGGRPPAVVRINGAAAELTDGRVAVPAGQPSTVVFGWN